MTTRRDFLEAAALSATAASLGRWRVIGASGARGFLDLRRAPDAIMAQTADGDLRLTSGGEDRWTGGRIVVTTAHQRDAVHVALSAPGVAIKRLHLRWRGDMSDARLVLGDAWERGYGDLEWRGWAPDRVMPWYFATYDGNTTNAYGVRTGANAFCFWQVDPAGVSLWTDVRSGGVGVQLGERSLDVCDVMCRGGRTGESAFAAIHAFCRQMCPSPRLPASPLYGSNDWYWTYGKNSAETVRADAAHIVELSPPGPNRPFVVIDDGWQPGRGADKAGAGTWDHGNDKFGDMAALAADVRRAGMLFVSLAPDALGAEQRRDLTAALARAASSQPLGEPLDWQRTVYPTRWRLMGRDVSYDWVGADGAGPP